MDTITHSLTGALIAYAMSPQKKAQQPLSIRTRVTCGAIAAAFPDIDYVTALINPLVFITSWHRGLTHSIVMLPLWALLLGILMALVFKRFRKWHAFVYICLLALFSHVLLDMMTSWGTQILSPLSDLRLRLDYAFVIDPLMTSIVLIAVIAAGYFRSSLIALAGIGMLVLYLATLSILHDRAEAIAYKHAHTKGWNEVNVTVLPQPFSPFHWKLVISNAEGHWLAWVNLAKGKSTTAPTGNTIKFYDIRKFYLSENHLTWNYYSRFGEQAVAEVVWNHPGFALYRRFAQLPAVYDVDRSPTDTCIGFMDLRFLLPGLNTPFRYGMCKPHAGTAWQLYRISPFSDSERKFVDG